MLRRVALLRIDVTEELSAFFIRVTRIGELGKTSAVTSYRRMLRRFLQPHGVTSQKTPFFIVTAVKNLKSYIENTTFRKFDVLPTSAVGRETPTLLGPLQNEKFSHWATVRLF
jgi:hypothetical protein